MGRGKKIAIITISVKPMFEKLLTTSTKVALVKDVQNVNMGKIWF